MGIELADATEFASVLFGSTVQRHRRLSVAFAKVSVLIPVLKSAILENLMLCLSGGRSPGMSTAWAVFLATWFGYVQSGA